MASPMASQLEASVASKMTRGRSTRAPVQLTDKAKRMAATMNTAMGTSANFVGQGPLYRALKGK